MELKDNMPSRAEGFFSRADHLKERIKKGQTGKEQRSKDWFIHSQVDLPVKPRQCESTCRSFAVLDSVLIRDRRAITIAVTTAIHNVFSTMWNKIPNGSHCFHWHTKFQWQLGAPWWSLSQCQARATCHIQQSNIQCSLVIYSNLPTQTVALIGEEHCFSLGAALAWFTHPTAMASNFRSETDSHVGLGSEVDLEAPCSVETTAQQAVVLFGGRETFSSLKVEQNRGNQFASSNEHLFSIDLTRPHPQR